MKTLTEKELNEFKANSNKIWINKLVGEYYTINATFSRYAKNIALSTPNFRIDNLGAGKWGQWNPTNRVISLHEDLFKFYPWTAVIHVLKHEFAHQIVSEHFKMDDFVSHSEAWERACKMVNVDPNVTASYSFLMNDSNHIYDKMGLRIQKLMALGESSFKGESESALTKAYELMERYKIRVARKQEPGKTFISRPLGVLFRKMPNYVWAIGRLLNEFYNVRYIQMHHYDEKYRHMKYIEIFGEPHHLEIAEYVFYFVIFEAERQWEEFKQSKDFVKGVHGKIAWIREFINGFWRKLQDQQCKMKKRIETIEEACQSLVVQYDQILEGRYRSNYPNMKHISTITTRYRSGTGGYEAGQKTNLRTAVRGGSSNGKMLTA